MLMQELGEGGGPELDEGGGPGSLSARELGCSGAG
jgi:hypothetical protein